MPKRSTRAGAFRAERPQPLSLRLAWAGGPVPADVPIRDLDEGDLHRVHRVRALMASGGEWVPPATPEDLEAIALELSASGAFTRESAPTPTEPPAEPAQQE